MDKKELKYNKINNEVIAEIQDHLDDYWRMFVNIKKIIKINSEYSENPELDEHLIHLAMWQVLSILINRNERVLELEEEWN